MEISYPSYMIKTTQHGQNNHNGKLISHQFSRENGEDERRKLEGRPLAKLDDQRVVDTPWIDDITRTIQCRADPIEHIVILLAIQLIELVHGLAGSRIEDLTIAERPVSLRLFGRCKATTC